MSRSLTIQINSHDRVSGSATDFTVNLGKDHKISNVRAVAIKSLQMVNSFYNINQYNNIWYYDQGGAELSIVVPVGQYNITQLIAAIQQQFQLAGIVIGIIDNQITHKLSFSAVPDISYYKTRPDGSLNPIHRILGIRSGIPLNPIKDYDAQAVHDLSGVKSVNITSNVLAGGMGISSRDSGSKLALLDVCPINVPFGAVVHSDPVDLQLDSLTYDNVLNNNLTVVDIQLRDEDNNVLDSNDLNVVISLKIYH